MTDRCRPERITVDGEEVTVLVHGNQPLTDAGRAALGEISAAVRRHLDNDPRWRATHVVIEHARDGTRCRCGAPARLDQQHAAHVVDRLIAAGLVNPAGGGT